MSERLLDYDAASGLKTWFDASDDGQKWHLRYEQDTAPVLDANKSQQTDGFDRRAEWWHAARVPASVMIEWKEKHGVDLFNPADKAGVRRLLNSNEYAYLRTNNFRL